MTTDKTSSQRHPSGDLRPFEVTSPEDHVYVVMARSAKDAVHIAYNEEYTTPIDPANVPPGEIPCPHCHGTGYDRGAHDDRYEYEVCEGCKGRKTIPETEEMRRIREEEEERDRNADNVFSFGKYDVIGEPDEATAHRKLQNREDAYVQCRRCGWSFDKLTADLKCPGCEALRRLHQYDEVDDRWGADERDPRYHPQEDVPREKPERRVPEPPLDPPEYNYRYRSYLVMGPEGTTFEVRAHSRDEAVELVKNI